MAGGLASDVVVSGVYDSDVVVAMLIGGGVHGVGRPVGLMHGEPATGGTAPFAFFAWVPSSSFGGAVGRVGGGSTSLHIIGG